MNGVDHRLGHSVRHALEAIAAGTGAVPLVVDASNGASVAALFDAAEPALRRAPDVVERVLAPIPTAPSASLRAVKKVIGARTLTVERGITPPSRQRVERRAPVRASSAAFQAQRGRHDLVGSGVGNNRFAGDPQW